MTVGRIRELDGLRGMAILLVLLWHGLALPTDPETAWGRWVWKTLMLTWTGVDLFFVLSGFLIGGIILDRRHSENFFRVFYARRVYRILPPYLVLLAAYLVARGTRWVTDHPAVDLALFNDPLPFWTYATFTQNFAMAFAGSLGAVWLSVTWSL